MKSPEALIDKAIPAWVWDNRSEAARCANTERPLAHLVDLTDRQDDNEGYPSMNAHRIPIEQRFWPKVEFTGFCWLWTAHLDHSGYGVTWLNGRNHGAHRVGYEILMGPIEPGLFLDHLCRVPRCVNPDHLLPCTPRENTFAKNSQSLTVQLALRDECIRGHRLVEPNLILSALERGSRVCLSCSRARSNRRVRGNPAEIDRLAAIHYERIMGVSA